MEKMTWIFAGFFVILFFVGFASSFLNSNGESIKSAELLGKIVRIALLIPLGLFITAIRFWYLIALAAGIYLLI